MGTEISWIAVKGLSSDEVMNALDFEPAPDGERRPKASLRDMGDGWTVVLTSHFGFPTPDRMKALSRGGVAIACSADDRLMYSVAEGYRDGEAEWAVEHDGGSHGPTHMAVAGRPPPHWSSIRARLTKQQKREDRGKREVDICMMRPWNWRLRFVVTATTGPGRKDKS